MCGTIQSTWWTRQGSSFSSLRKLADPAFPAMWRSVFLIFFRSFFLAIIAPLLLQRPRIGAKIRTLLLGRLATKPLAFLVSLRTYPTPHLARKEVEGLRERVLFVPFCRCAVKWKGQ